ncbi:PAC2 family protein [Aeromicrobium phragmitis]|uniref:PAC2 family protein n=1 Tax=Aeromicrobium phragmitis TaxID=2478914 RepID=UPI001FB5D54E|nr:PAC2 family protein [Aeromicrobium phragmitis]
MTEIWPSDEHIASLRRPCLVAAFEGWNDAADAATGTIDHLIEEWDAQEFAEFDAEELYDFQETRPIVRGEDEERRIFWPTPTVFLARPPHGDRDVLLLRAIEPNYRWRTFSRQVVDLAQRAGVSELVCLGALLADAPHSRPVPVTGSTDDPTMGQRLSLQASRYNGPIGIPTVLADTAHEAGIASASLWAAVPHYLAEPPCPKATFALLGALEDALAQPLPEGSLSELAAAWQRGADDITASDEELAEYVQALEQERDSAGAPEASGESIAREFERYLRRRDLGQ